MEGRKMIGIRKKEYLMCSINGGFYGWCCIFYHTFVTVSTKILGAIFSSAIYVCTMLCCA